MGSRCLLTIHVSHYDIKNGITQMSSPQNWFVLGPKELQNSMGTGSITDCHCCSSCNYKLLESVETSKR